MLSQSIHKRLISLSCAHLRGTAKNSRHSTFGSFGLLDSCRKLSIISTSVESGNTRGSSQDIKQKVENLMGGGKPLNSKKTLKPKGVSANVTRVTPPIDLLSEDNLKALKISQIKEAIDSYVKNDSYFTAAIDALQKAKNGNLPIGGEYLFRGISACAMGTRNSKALDLAFWAFDVIKVENEAFLKPDSRQCTPIYEALLAVCSRWNDMPRAVGLMEDFQARGHTYTSYILSTYIMLAANDGTSKEVHEILLPLYSTYKSLSKQRHFKISPKVFVSVAARLCRMGRSDEALLVLSDLTEVNHEPSAALCDPLLNAALAVSDTAVLRVLLTWYKTNFNMSLGHGQSTRILNISAAVGDGQLALMAFQMLRTAGFEPSVNNYAALVRALLLSRDVISATEVLQEMDRVGITFTHTIAAPGGGTRSVFNERQYLTLKALLVEALAARPTPESGDDRDQQFFMAKQLIDTLYTALAEQARAARNADGGSVADFVPAPTTGGTYGDDTVAEASLAAEEEMTGERSDGEKMTEAAADADGPTASVDAGAGAAVVPRIVLDALVEASGNLGMADRAFAIFQDYHSLFDVTPDIHSYNSLLTACAKQRKVNMNAIFTVFQELEASCPSRCDDDMEYSYNNQQQQDISQTQDAGAVGGVEAGMEGEGQERAVVDAEVPSPPAPVSKANGQSFSILFEAMTACRDLRVFDQVFDHMLASGVMASPNALREVSIALALSGQHWKSVERVKEVLMAQRLGMHPRDMTSAKIAARLSSLNLNSSGSSSGRNPRDGIATKKNLLPPNFERRLAAIKEGQVRAALISPTLVAKVQS